MTTGSGEKKAPVQISQYSWSKEYVEHLRTVHFTLIGVAVTLIALVWGSEPYHVTIAAQQVKELVQLKDEWPGGWVKNIPPEIIGDKRGDVAGIGVGIRFANCVENGLRTDDRTQSEPSVYRFSFKDQWELATLDGKSWEQWAPHRFSDIESWWNELTNPALLDQPVLLDQPIAMDKHLMIGDSTLSFNCDISDFNIIKPSLLRKVTSILPRNGESKSKIVAVTEANTKLEMAVIERLQFKLDRSSLLKKLPHWNPDRSFVDLSRAAKGLESSPLEELEKHLNDESAKGHEVFEAFGVKFPTGQISGWGIVVLLSIQCYFYIYLKQRSGALGLDDPVWDVPWIGMDRSPLAEAIYGFTVVIVPIIAIALLHAQILFSGWNETWKVWLWDRRFAWDYKGIVEVIVLIFALAVSCLLSRAAWRYRPTNQEIQEKIG